ncbi:MAG: 5'-methylthioadenosine/adenosylhomocysteine nucleosidase [Lachnospiraceae bacterium]|nr:5'-methylthioadenosine/adenosylhomocysteine nucleosidase [Lachnospiraceae bacterium]
MKKLGIIGAMEEEVARLKEHMTEVSVTERASLTFYEGKLAGLPAVVVRSGIGKVNAAICTQQLIDLFGVDAVVNTGIAGSLNAKIDIGDIVLSTDALEHDMDAVAFGYEVGVIPRMDTSVFVADESLRALAAEVCLEVNPEVSVHEGRIVTGDQFIADKAKKEWLVSTFAGMCTEMEGAAIAHAAHNNGIPFLIIRAISDKADDSATEDYPTFETKAINHTVNLVCGLAKKLA